MSCVALKDFPKATFSGFTKRIRPTQTDVTYPKYMGFYLRSNFFRRTMTNNAVMTLRASLNEDIFSYLDLLLPDFDTQKKIGDFLYLLDDKIKINNRINTELEAMAKTIYNYWFIQFDFPNEEGKPYKASGGEMEYNEKLKMEIPVGWTDGKLSEVANITMGQSPDGDSYNEEGEGMVFFQGSTDFNFRFPLVRMFTTAPSRIAQEEDVLLSVRAPVGTLNVANEKCCIGRGLAALNSKNEANSFVLYLMFYFKAMFDVQDRTGTTFGSIDKDTLHDLKFAKPPVELQKQFQSIVGKYDKMILTRSRETQELITLRDFLLPLLMNGQVKLV
ncbi:MAG TPA: restriction endonuclease subunit S [Bacteroidia bacterium]|nr:restriction endonuclease subunit S [Bacteroidia bacterium]HNH65352.1 restriction endonuclease subunit S [Bacteroidia bacterium]